MNLDVILEALGGAIRQLWTPLGSIFKLFFDDVFFCALSAVLRAGLAAVLRALGTPLGGKCLTFRCSFDSSFLVCFQAL